MRSINFLLTYLLTKCINTPNVDNTGIVGRGATGQALGHALFIHRFSTSQALSFFSSVGTAQCCQQLFAISLQTF